MSGFLEGVLLLVACAAAVVSVAGIAVSRDSYARLIFGSVASGGAVVALVAAVAVSQGLSIVTAQCVVLLVLVVPSSAIATQCIAALVRNRAAAPPPESGPP